MAENRLFEKLSSLRSEDDLREIYSLLNYDYDDAPLPVRHWSDRVKTNVKEATILARHNDFLILYFKIDRLLLTPERDILSQALKDYPYFLAVFSDPTQENWHF